MTPREELFFAASSVGITRKPWLTVWDDVYAGAHWEMQRLLVGDESTLWVNDSHPGFPMPASKGVSMHRMSSGGYGWEWNPIKNDDDAMRLSVALGMTVDINRKVGQVTVFYRLTEDAPRSFVTENSEGDLAACTRLAITKAAAFIGQNLNGQRVVIDLHVPYNPEETAQDDSDSYKGMLPVTSCELEREQHILDSEISRLSDMLNARAPHFIDDSE
jgi:hypothetical protein